DWSSDVCSSDLFGAGTAATDVTAANGSYTLSGLKPGSYVVCETQQSPWIESKPTGSKCAATGSGADGGYAETLVSNQTKAGDDFGNYRNAKITGRKFDDLNADGTDNAGSDPGVGGFVVSAYSDTNGDGVLSATEFGAGTAATDVTAANGSYTLSGLKPGSYVVCETQQSPWIESKPTGSKCAATGSGADGGYAETLVSNQTKAGDDFGNYRNAKITGRKFDDLNADGTDNAGSDPGVGGFVVSAYSDTNGDGVLSATE